MKKDFDRRWEQLADEVLTGMKEWRLQHPRATFTEMERALDQRLARVRARMLEDMALASTAADWKEAQKGSRPMCPHCGVPLESRGQAGRRLQTNGGEEIHLERGYGVCSQCGESFFPSG